MTRFKSYLVLIARYFRYQSNFFDYCNDISHTMSKSSTISFILSFCLAFTPYYSNAQNNNDDVAIVIRTNGESFPPPNTQNALSSEGNGDTTISLNVSDPIPAAEITTEHVPDSSQLVMMTPDLYSRLRQFMKHKLWVPLKNQSNKVYAFATVKAPGVARDIVNAVKDPLASEKNVTIVTTLLGATSTVTSFTIGNALNGNSNVHDMITSGIMLLSIAVLYRYNYDAIGAFLNYKGWSPKKIKENIALIKAHDEKLKELKAKDPNANLELPEGLTKDKLSTRILKSFALELLILGAASSKNFISAKYEITKQFLWNFGKTNLGYTMYSFVDNIISLRMVEEKVNMTVTSQEQYEREHNKIVFKLKVLSIGLGFIQNIIATYSMSGNKIAVAVLYVLGAGFITYEYFMDRRQEKKSEELRREKEKISLELTCPGVFVH